MNENNAEDNKDPTKTDSERFSWRSRARAYFRSRLQLITRPGSQLGQRAVNAGFWAFGLSMTTRVLRTVRTVLIARLLAPEDFGLMGIALLMLSLLNTFSQTGFKRALIQKKGEVEDDFDTAWTIELLRAFVIAAVLGLAAPLIVNFSLSSVRMRQGRHVSVREATRFPRYSERSFGAKYMSSGIERAFVHFPYNGGDSSRRRGALDESLLIIPPKTIQDHAELFQIDPKNYPSGARAVPRTIASVKLKVSNETPAATTLPNRCGQNPGGFTRHRA